MCQNGIVVKDHLLEVNLHLSGVNLNIIDVKVNAALVNRKGTKMMDASKTFVARPIKSGKSPHK